MPPSNARTETRDFLRSVKSGTENFRGAKFRRAERSWIHRWAFDDDALELLAGSGLHHYA